MAVQKINFLKSTVWPATIPLRNNFIHPAVFSRLALQAKMIFSSQPPCSEDPLVRWQDLFLPAQCPRDLFRRPSRCWRGMPTHSHPLSPGSRGAREPLFCRSPGCTIQPGPAATAPEPGGPILPQAVLLPGWVTAASPQLAAAGPCPVPAGRPRPCSLLPCGPGGRPAGTAPKPCLFQLRLVVKKGYFHAGAKDFTLEKREDVWVRRGKAGGMDAQKPPAENMNLSIKKDGWSLAVSLLKPRNQGVFSLEGRMGVGLC